MRAWALAAACLLAACGGASGEGEPPVRLLAAGAALHGSAGGSERVGFSDGSSVNFVVTGGISITLPKGVYAGAAFPAEVTFAVKSSSGESLSGGATFERVRLDAARRFTGEVETGHGVSTLTGAFLAVSDATVAQVHSFSYDFTGATRTVYLQSDLLRVQRTAPQP